jgi:hypothetical protein
VKVRLISQASLLVESRGVRILSDPWYSERVYGDAWELCPAPPEVPDFGRLDALFVSHAHPDHLNPPTLRRILERAGPGIPVFVPKLFFGGLRDTLRSLGFADVREMTPGRGFEFRGLTLYSQQFRMDDSLLVVQGDETLVNLNDCPVRGATLRALARRFPRPEYVFAQFSVAQAYPYSYLEARPDWDKDDLIRRFASYELAFQPRCMVPFASLVRFCHQDNRHMNEHRTTLDELQGKGLESLTVLHPGDSIEAGRPARDPGGRQRYLQGLALEDFVPRRSVAVAAIREPLQAFLAGLRHKVPGRLLGKMPPVRIVFNDVPQGLQLDFAAATHATFSHDPSTPLATSPREPIVYALSTATFLEAVSNPWGWADLQIGAKFRARVEPGFEAREYWVWAMPILAAAGYLPARTLWFLRPRSLAVAWGRRLEILDYLRRWRRGSFMADVVRSKADYGGEGVKVGGG